MNNILTHAQIIEKINDLLDRYQSDMSYCHGADHAWRVAKLALMIVEHTNADRQIVEIAALLHDIGVVPLAWGRHASGRDDYDFQEFMGAYALPSADHGEVGALIAGRFLKQIGYPESKTEQVVLIINEHNTLDKTTLESKIVNDADRLELIGATWVARAFQRTNAFDRSISIESIPDKYLKGRKQILDGFHTEIAKKMGTERYDFLESFIEQFQREMRLEA
jgi:uncharacterized protein